MRTSTYVLLKSSQPIVRPSVLGLFSDRDAAINFAQKDYGDKELSFFSDTHAQTWTGEFVDPLHPWKAATTVYVVVDVDEVAHYRDYRGEPQVTGGSK